MNTLKTGFFLMLLLLYGCNPCNNLDCVSSNYSAPLRITRASDGVDLLFGPNKSYDKNKIRAYALNGRDTVAFECKPYLYRSAGYDSILSVELITAPAQAFIRLSDTDTDTLSISYRTFDSKCCGTITEITSLRLNNNIDITDGRNVLMIRK